MLKDIWRVMTGRLSWQILTNTRRSLQFMSEECDFQHRRANEAVRLYNEGEVARKQSSDALGNAVIKQILGDK